MDRDDAAQVETVSTSPLFDATWYSDRYPDVGILGMDPARHYVRYGSIIGRDSGPDLPTAFARRAFGIRPPQDPISWMAAQADATTGHAQYNPKSVLIAASEVAKRGDHDKAIGLAETYLPDELAHTVDILHSNAALDRSDVDGWVNGVNGYLAHFNIAPLRLQGFGTHFNQLSCDALPAVTGGPLISVIMPAWNAERTIRKATASILDQTWQNLELLIVDDCSSDGTWSALQDIAARDSRVKIMRNVVNTGPYVAKNIALTQASGEWVTGHDADDWAHPQRITNHIALAKAQDCDASLTYMLRMLENGKTEYLSDIGGFSTDGVCRVSSISTLFRGKFIRNKLGFWDTVRFGADSEMISRARVLLGDGFRNFETIGMICLDTPNTLTNNVMTGIRTATGLSPVRKAYKDSWAKLHLKMPARDCYLPFLQKHRRYESPAEMVVPNDRIIQAQPDIASHLTEKSSLHIPRIARHDNYTVPDPTQSITTKKEKLIFSIK
ncbi:glycosyltransferase family 2 protein [Loktanella sp. DJP18]|uniref:glycosyltransferase family 2 protein n=1 Tax=Loktanella sp. DJP18 TaxID=3409788 RepID=UPI003BB4A9F8